MKETNVSTVSTGTRHVSTKRSRLTDRQTKMLNAVRDHIRTYGEVPTRNQLLEATGLRYQAAVDSHLQALERKGWLVIERGQARGIKLLRDDTPIALPEDVPFVAAGTPIEAVEDDVQPKMQTVQRLWNTFAGLPDYFLEVRGDSMDRAGVRSGDLVAVRRNPDPKEGDMVIARIGTEITMKRYHLGRGCVELKPESTNPNHVTIRVDRGMDYEIVGVVVGAVIGMRRDEADENDG